MVPRSLWIEALTYVVLLLCIPDQANSQTLSDLLQDRLVGDDNIGEEAARQAGSLFEAFFANQAAIGNGDVSLVVSSSFDTGDYSTGNGSIIADTVIRHRLVFDFENNRFLYARVSDYDLALIGHKDQKKDIVESFSKSLQGFVKFNDVAFAREYPNPIVELRQDVSFSTLFSRFDVPDPRTIGVVVFGNTSDFDTIRRIVDRLSTGHGLKKLAKASDTEIVLEFEIENPRDDSNHSVSTVTFDVVRNIPTKRTIEIVDHNNNNHRALMTKEEITWDEKDGIFVPVEIHKEQNGARRINGRYYVGIKQIDVKLDWNSLNAELRDELFHKRNINDINRLVNLAENAKGLKE